MKNSNLVKGGTAARYVQQGLLGMGIFFSWADLGNSESGLSLLGWLLGGWRLGMGIFFSWADLAHSEGDLSLLGWLLGG